MTTDLRGAKVQAKIRDAQLELVPYMIVAGPREAASGEVALRDRIEGDLGAMPIQEALARLGQEVEQKTIRQVVKTKFATLEEGSGEQHEY